MMTMKKVSSERKIGAYFLTLAAGFFKTSNEAVHLADNLKDMLEYWCKNESWSIEMISYICDEKPEGKQNKKPDEKIDPHLHFVLLAYPGATICARIKEYLTKKVGKQSCVNVQRINDLSKLRYYLSQLVYFRTLLMDSNELPEFKAVSKYSDRLGIIEDIEDFLYSPKYQIIEKNKEVKTTNFWDYLIKKDALSADTISMSWFDSDTI